MSLRSVAASFLENVDFWTLRNRFSTLVCNSFVVYCAVQRISTSVIWFAIHISQTNCAYVVAFPYSTGGEHMLAKSTPIILGRQRCMFSSWKCQSRRMVTFPVVLDVWRWLVSTGMAHTTKCNQDCCRLQMQTMFGLTPCREVLRWL